MDDLPIEIIQVINDQLDFFDQIHFKSSCKWYCEKIKIKQFIPYLLIRKNIAVDYECDGIRYTLEPTDCICLNKFYVMMSKYTLEKDGSFYDINILGFNKYTKLAPTISDFYEFDIFDLLVKYIGIGENGICFYDEYDRIPYELTDYEFGIQIGQYYGNNELIKFNRKLNWNHEYVNYKQFIKLCLENTNDIKN